MEGGVFTLVTKNLKLRREKKYCHCTLSYLCDLFNFVSLFYFDLFVSIFTPHFLRAPGKDFHVYWTVCYFVSMYERTAVGGPARPKIYERDILSMWWTPTLKPCITPYSPVLHGLLPVPE